MTDAAPSVLTALELDALTELVNLGVSKAALSLREMVGQQVHSLGPERRPHSSRSSRRALGQE